MGQDGQYYSLSPEEELRALDAVRKAGDLLRVQSKLQAKADRAPTLSAWAKAARLSEAGLKQALANGLAAKRLLVATNIPLVYNIVYKQYVKKIARECLQVSVNDLIQEGILGLAHAVELYDGSQSAGARFRTYAWYWIKAYIDQGILSGGHAVKLPRRAMQAYDSAVRTLTAQLQRSPTEDEIAKHMGLSTEELSRKYSIAKGGGMLSLDSRFSDGGDMQDHLLNVRAIDTEGEEASQGRDLRAALLTALSPRERELLALRFGLDDGRQRTIKECAQAMMLSLNVTRQLLDGSIAKVRAHILTQEADVLEAASVAV
ncbi:hypothetical protein JKP88DRAFT_190851 [Tribonema minus]|uniref:Uncharacterized protein n=1 Tax=Tribonema minus TaxID=303371 RepID=A0A835ZKK6_9STRA|nr:hypothetical protein JKP88DRAFT_190851 [Tribonema minus]